MKIQHAIIIALVCVVFYFILTPRHGQSHGPYIERVRRFSKIGNALENYSWDHDNQLPAKLSELCPQYIHSNELSVFYPSNPKMPLGWDTKPELVDTFSDCVYLGTSGIPHEVIAYEREGDWNLPDGKLDIISPGGGGCHVTKQELNELLHANESAILDHLRKLRVSYYEGNLHASLNGYRIDFRTYPRGDNASVTTVLRGSNPNKKQYHSSYKQDRNPHGEDIDPWGTPYLIESDGNTVKTKSAGKNRKFNEVGSSDYDDICLSVTGGSVISEDTKF